jgi:signal transduction histidine kinase
MLEFSILEAGRLRLNYSVFSVRDLLDSLISSQGYASDAEVTMEIPDGLTFNADATRIGTVIGSILSNAVAYSRPPRRIRITSISSESDGFHRLAISDNGVGIAQEQLGSIFEPFQLADSEKLSRKYERIGLSLAIARQYLRMHGGDITVASTINAGTTFTIHIPKTPGAKEACG